MDFTFEEITLGLFELQTCMVQLIPETTGMGCKCTLTVNHDRITDLQWQAMDRTLPENLAEIAGEASKTSEITSSWL